MKQVITLQPGTAKLIRAGVPTGHPAKRLIDRWQKRLSAKGGKPTLVLYASEVKRALNLALRYGQP